MVLAPFPTKQMFSSSISTMLNDLTTTRNVGTNELSEQ